MKPAPIKDLIYFEDFEKLDIRVGTIVTVSEVEKSNKLMKLSVDFGDHTRSILAGIKKERENPILWRRTAPWEHKAFTKIHHR